MAQYWLVPMAKYMSDAEIAEQSKLTRVSLSLKGEVSLVQALRAAKVAKGDYLAWLWKNIVAALGRVEAVSNLQIIWVQCPLKMQVDLPSWPSEVQLADTSQIGQIWGLLNPVFPPVVAPDMSVAPDVADEAAPAPEIEEDLWSLPAKAEGCDPQNILLYGPPGTGKTWSVKKRAVELILGKEEAAKNRASVEAAFTHLQNTGQVEFVTFHQSYGYEDFVEGLRPVLEGEGLTYEVHEGVFKRICKEATEAGNTPPVALSFEELWRLLIFQVNNGLELPSKDTSTIYKLSVGSSGGINFITGGSSKPTISQTKLKKAWEAFTPKPPHEVSTSDMDKIDSYSGSYLWVLYRWLYEHSQENKISTLHFTPATPQYVLIIDEINRGNISKIFGELITLLEPDKRLGMPDELRLSLASSPKHHFAVPPNLHVIGTLNTADRSIALMDVALRRRFVFEELMPDISALNTVLGEKKVPSSLQTLTIKLLTWINKRICFLYDRDHQIGHAYFMNVKSIEDLRDVLARKVIPLLQEYFYGSWDKVALVLGCPRDEKGELKLSKYQKDGKVILECVALNEKELLGFDHEDYENQVQWSIHPSFQPGHAEYDQPKVDLWDIIRQILPQAEA